MSRMLLLLLFAVFVQGSFSTDWAEDALEDNAVLYPCKGSDLTLNWSINNTGTNFTLLHAELSHWYHSRNHSILFADGAWSMSPDYTGRAQWVGEGKLIVKNVTARTDGGEYYMVYSFSEDGKNKTLTRTARVFVMDVNADAERPFRAVRIPATKRFLGYGKPFSLKCGGGPFKVPYGSPRWTGPSGELLQFNRSTSSHESSRYDNGTQYFNYESWGIPNTFEEGIYTCTMDPPEAAVPSQCAPSQNSAQFYVATTQERLQILELVLEQLGKKFNGWSREAMKKVESPIKRVVQVFDSLEKRIDELEDDVKEIKANLIDDKNNSIDRSNNTTTNNNKS